MTCGGRDLNGGLGGDGHAKARGREEVGKGRCHAKTSVREAVYPIKTKVNPIDGAEMVWVAPGSFEMGDNEGHSQERPMHRVQLTRGYWIYKTEVTNAMYKKFMAATLRRGIQSIRRKEFSGDQQPVAGLAVWHADQYAEWAHAELPSEAEWEYAARGPKSFPYPWGTAPPAYRFAVFGQVAGPRTANVGSRLAGASWCGALDLAGNVREWTREPYSPNFYKTPDALKPDPEYVGESNRRAVRGNCWDDGTWSLAASRRTGDSSEDNPIEAEVGFRCIVRDSGAPR